MPLHEKPLFYWQVQALLFQHFPLQLLSLNLLCNHLDSRFQEPVGLMPRLLRIGQTNPSDCRDH